MDETGQTADSLPLSNGDLYLSREYLLSLRDFCIAQQVDVFDVMQRAQVPLQEFLDATPYISAKICYNFCRQVEAILETPLTTGIAFGRWMALKNAHGNLGMALRSSRDFSQACKLLEKYIQIRTNAFNLTWHMDNEFLFITVIDQFAGLKGDGQRITQFFIMTCLLNAEHFVRQSVSEVGLDYEVCVYLKSPLTEQLSLENIKIITDHPVNGLRIPLSIATATFSSYNLENYRRLTELLGEESKTIPTGGFLEKVKYTLRGLDWEEVTLKKIAPLLNMSESTLQRRLKEKGTSFQAIKAAERINKAKELLMLTNDNLDVIAQRLGFSNSSNFSKSFKMVVGQSPKAFRSTKF